MFRRNVYQGEHPIIEIEVVTLWGGHILHGGKEQGQPNSGIRFIDI
jgi:hypothetical protein